MSNWGKLLGVWVGFELGCIDGVAVGTLDSIFFYGLILGMLHGMIIVGIMLLGISDGEATLGEV